MFFKPKTDKETLLIAISKNDLTLIKELIKTGISLNFTDSNNLSPLDKAVITGNIEIIETLINSGFDIDYKNKHGRTALFTAVTYSYKKRHIVDFFVKNGADINVQDCDGKTPLLRAIEENQITIAKIFIKNKALFDLEDMNQNTALKLSKQKKHSALLTLMGHEQDKQKRERPTREVWEKVNRSSVAFITTNYKIKRRITEIFNFKSHSRTTIVENMILEKENLAIESFNVINDRAIKDAFTIYKKCGGKISKEDVFKNHMHKPLPRNTL